MSILELVIHNNGRSVDSTRCMQGDMSYSKIILKRNSEYRYSPLFIPYIDEVYMHTIRKNSLSVAFKYIYNFIDTCKIVTPKHTYLFVSGCLFSEDLHTCYCYFSEGNSYNQSGTKKSTLYVDTEAMNLLPIKNFVKKLILESKSSIYDLSVCISDINNEITSKVNRMNPMGSVIDENGKLDFDIAQMLITCIDNKQVSFVAENVNF